MSLTFGTTNQIPKLDKVAKGTRIAFSGPMCSGKTFCANYLRDTKGYEVFSFAGKLKAIAYELYGTQGKDGKARELYQELGDALRSFDNDVFIKYLLFALSIAHSSCKVVIDDVRLPREAHLLRANGFQIIEVQCDEGTRTERIGSLYPSLSQGARSHATEVSAGKIRSDTSIISEDASLTEHLLDELMVNYWTSR